MSETTEIAAHRAAPDDVAALRNRIDARLAELAPPPGATPRVLTEAMRYALTTPGKRTRPIFTLLCAQRFGGRSEAALDAACAFEMVHAASLALDDLPCMDGADVRRGRPTVHRSFGEDAAVLAGVALLNEAFGVLARCPGLPAETARRLIASLSQAVGPSGLTGGQMRDLRERASAEASSLTRLNHEKTGVLFCTAGEAGAVIGGASEREAAAISTFARHIGAAFQIRDDVIDATASSFAAAKDVGRDAGKPTFASLLGVDGAITALRAEQDAADAALTSIGPRGLLGAFSDRLLALDWMQTAEPRSTAVG